jgi:hypothetical protein
MGRAAVRVALAGIWRDMWTRLGRGWKHIRVVLAHPAAVAAAFGLLPAVGVSLMTLDAGAKLVAFVAFCSGGLAAVMIARAMEARYPFAASLVFRRDQQASTIRNALAVDNEHSVLRLARELREIAAGLEERARRDAASQ